MHRNGIPLPLELQYRLDPLQRERHVRMLADALIQKFRLNHSPLVALQFAHRPCRTVREAMVAFVAHKTMSAETKALPTLLDLLARQVSERLSDLYGDME